MPCPEWDQLEALRGRTQLAFRREDSLRAELEETDLLFLDTRHDAEPLRQELARHAGKVRKYLVLHGTTQFAEQGETPSSPGIGPVVEELLREGTFRLKERHENSQGLAVLERVVPDRPCIVEGGTS